MLTSGLYRGRHQVVWHKMHCTLTCSLHHSLAIWPTQRSYVPRPLAEFLSKVSNRASTPHARSCRTQDEAGWLLARLYWMLQLIGQQQVCGAFTPGYSRKVLKQR